MQRVLEPELMDTAEEAASYDSMDHVEVNARFCEDLLAARPALPSPILDVGTGTARIPIELCRRVPDVRVVAIDLARHMIARGRENVARAGLSARIAVELVDAKALPYPDGAFDATVSNSIVHHIPDPAVLFGEMWRVTAPGGLVFVRDLARPGSPEEVTRLVDRYVGAPPDAPEARREFDRQRELLRASLCAALTIDEIVALLAPLGVPRDKLRLTSDRHWTLSTVKP